MKVSADELEKLFTFGDSGVMLVPAARNSAKEPAMPAEIVLTSHEVPRTGVKIEISVRYADRRLAELLGDRPGTGLWVARYSTTRRVGERMAFGNYLSFSRLELDEARAIANELWTDSVQRRDANGA